MNAMRLILCGVLIGVFSPHGQGQTVPSSTVPSSWKKSCLMGVQGNEGCTVKVTMRMDPNGPCHDNIPEYCVKIEVSCPPDIPPGDPGEPCEDEICDICGDQVTGVSIVCDGQTFTAHPAPNKFWQDVATDCSNLKIN